MIHCERRRQREVKTEVMLGRRVPTILPAALTTLCRASCSKKPKPHIQPAVRIASGSDECVWVCVCVGVCAR